MFEFCSKSLDIYTEFSIALKAKFPKLNKIGRIDSVVIYKRVNREVTCKDGSKKREFQDRPKCDLAPVSYWQIGEIGYPPGEMGGKAFGRITRGERCRGQRHAVSISLAYPR